MSQASNNSTKRVSAETMHKVKETLSSLPSDDCWKHVQPLCLYQGFWCYPFLLENIILAQQLFKPKISDIFVCSPPKHGTTWIKSLTIAIVTRTRFETSPLLSKLSHEIVPQLELWNFTEGEDLRPREIPIIPTHIPYDSLPLSVRDSYCKIVYICRNPKDAFISEYQFGASLRSKDAGESDIQADEINESIALEEAFDLYFQGKSLFGPCWDHALGYWKASLERPEKVLFLKYEDLKKDTKFCVRKLGEFMGYPFSIEEEKEGAVEKIVDLCSFENLSNLEVNKTGTFLYPNMLRFPNKTFFRKGKVGDWRKHLTPEMAERINKIIEEKLKNSGLSFSALW